MDHGFDALLAQRFFQDRGVRQFADEEPAVQCGRAVAAAEVVEGPHFVAAFREETGGVATDVARAARNQNAHRVIL